MAFVHLAMVVRSMVGGFFGKTSFLSATFLSATFLSGAFLSGHLKQVLDVSVELPLVGLHRQQVVGAAVDDLLGNLGLAAHGVNGDDAPAQLQQRQQLGDGGDFVGMGLGVPRQLYLPVGVNQFCRFTSLAWPRCWAALVR